MRILFITDPHFDADINKTKGIDTKQRFIDILDKGITYHPSMIVLGGDLCNMEGEESTYYWFKEILDATNIPYHVIPGNHDNGSMMARIFYGETRNECFRMTEDEDRVYLFMDSSVGSFSNEQWSWLDNIISVEKNILLFMHHPSVLIGSKHMEPKYAFTQIDRFAELMKNINGSSLSIFSGHFHMEANKIVGNMDVYVTPSTFIQIDPNSEKLEMITDKAGFRIIEASNKGITTSVLYINY